MRLKNVALVFGMVLLLGNSIIVNAYDSSLTAKGDATDVLSWHQSNHPERNDPSVPKEAGTFEVASGRSLGEMGCSYFAISYMLVKMGEENPKDGFTPVEFAKKVKEGNYFVGQNYVDFSSINKMYPNITCEENKISAKGTSLKEQKAWVKKKFDEGYFIVICITSNHSQNGHYIFVDGFDEDGEMIIGDSAYTKNKWSDTYSKDNGKIATVTLFKHKSKKANECPSIYDNVKLGSSKLSKEEEETYSGLVKEWELNGMPKTTTYFDKQNMIVLDTGDSLTDIEKENVSVVKKNIEGRHLSIVDIIGIIIQLLGIVICTYAVVLGVGSILDITNNWLDFSLVERMTFGKCRVIDELDANDIKVRKGDFTLKKMLFNCIIVSIIGILLISGVIGNCINIIVNWLIGV